MGAFMRSFAESFGPSYRASGQDFQANRRYQEERKLREEELQRARILDDQERQLRDQQLGTVRGVTEGYLPPLELDRPSLFGGASLGMAGQAGQAGQAIPHVMDAVNQLGGLGIQNFDTQRSLSPQHHEQSSGMYQEPAVHTTRGPSPSPLAVPDVGLGLREWAAQSGIQPRQAQVGGTPYAYHDPQLKDQFDRSQPGWEDPNAEKEEFGRLQDAFALHYGQSEENPEGVPQALIYLSDSQEDLSQLAQDFIPGMQAPDFEEEAPEEEDIDWPTYRAIYEQVRAKYTEPDMSLTLPIYDDPAYQGGVAGDILGYEHDPEAPRILIEGKSEADIVRETMAILRQIKENPMGLQELGSLGSEPEPGSTDEAPDRQNLFPNTWDYDSELYGTGALLQRPVSGGDVSPTSTPTEPSIDSVSSQMDSEQVRLWTETIRGAAIPEEDKAIFMDAASNPYITKDNLGSLYDDLIKDSVTGSSSSGAGSRPSAPEGVQTSTSSPGDTTTAVEREIDARERASELQDEWERLHLSSSLGAGYQG